jgi:hypothetical protein
MTQIVLVGLLVLGGFWFYRKMTAQLMVIHDLVNSNLTKVQADLKVALDRIEQLETYITRDAGAA